MHAYGYISPSLDLPWIDMHVEIDPVDLAHEAAIADAWTDLAYGGRDIAARHGRTAATYAVAAAVDLHRHAEAMRLQRALGLHAQLRLCTMSRITLHVPMGVLADARAWYERHAQPDFHR